MTLALTVGLFAMLSWGLADFLAKVSLDQLNEVTVLFWSQLVGVLPIAVFAVGAVPTWQWSWTSSAALLGFGAVEAGTYVLQYRGFKRGKVSVLSPLFSSYAALVTVLSVPFLHEHLDALTLTGIAVVFVGALLVTSDGGGATSGSGKMTAGAADVLASAFIYSFWVILFDRFVKDHTWILALVAIRLISSVACLGIARVSRVPLRLTSRKLIGAVAAVGIFDSGAYIAVAKGYSATRHAGVIAVVSGAFAVPTAVLAYWLLKERLRMRQVIAIGFVIGGICALSLQ